MRRLIPLGLFILLVILLGVGLTRDPHRVPSPLIGKPMPAFELPALYDPSRKLSLADLKGRVTLVNVFASWCVACREEHPLLVNLAASGKVAIIGIDYKDERPTAQQYLKRFGDPYETVIYDRQGKLGLDLGVYGVPETYVIDRQGIIRYKQIGPFTEDALRDTILPLVKQLGATDS